MEGGKGRWLLVAWIFIQGLKLRLLGNTGLYSSMLLNQVLNRTLEPVSLKRANYYNSCSPEKACALLWDNSLFATVEQHISQERFVLKQPQVARRRFRLDIRKKFFAEMMTGD